MRLIRSRFLLAALACLAGIAHGGSFGVSPTRVDLDRATRTTIVEVTNDDQRKLGFQVKLFEWTQDAEGKDQYAESQDLIWFPQMFSIAPGEKRIIRVGTKAAAPTALEKSYRLFIEELPPATEPGAGASLKIVLRFGVPIFVAPVAPQKKVVVESVQARPGKALVRLRNEGNQSVRFETLRLRRGEETVGEAQGWYVLGGAIRGFEVVVDTAKCPLAGALGIEGMVEGQVVLKHAFDATPVLCQRS